MGKKKGATRQVHPQQSFQQLVAEATLQKFAPYINAQIDQVGQQLMQFQMRQLSTLTLRLRALEETLVEKLGVTKAELALKVAVYEDQVDGLEEVKEVQLGDRVRVEICHKKNEDAEFSQFVPLMINSAGVGATLGKELEDSLIGLQVGETREVVFGPEGSMTAQIKLNRVSRRVAPPASPVDAVQEETQPEQEAALESSNAG